MLLCIYMHSLKWNLIAEQSVCLVDPISVLLSQFWITTSTAISITISIFLGEAMAARVTRATRVLVWSSGSSRAVVCLGSCGAVRIPLGGQAYGIVWDECGS